MNCNPHCGLKETITCGGGPAERRTLTRSFVHPNGVCTHRNDVKARVLAWNACEASLTLTRSTSVREQIMALAICLRLAKANYRMARMAGVAAQRPARLLSKCCSKSLVVRTGSSRDLRRYKVVRSRGNHGMMACAAAPLTSVPRAPVGSQKFPEATRRESAMEHRRGRRPDAWSLIVRDAAVAAKMCA